MSLVRIDMLNWLSLPNVLNVTLSIDGFIILYNMNYGINEITHFQSECLGMAVIYKLFSF